MKYEGPHSYQSKDIANVKVFADGQTHGQKDGPKTIDWGYKNEPCSVNRAFTASAKSFNSGQPAHFVQADMG